MRSDAEIFFLLSGVVLIALIWLVSLLLLFVAYLCAGDIFKHLKNSPAVRARQSSLGWEPIGRFLFINNVATLLIFSRKSIKNGELDFVDYQRFPVGLRRLIKVLNGILLVLSGMTVVGVIVGELNGWLK